MVGKQQQVFLLAVPFLAYGVYAKLARRATAKGDGWRRATWFWLTASELSLSLAAAVALAVGLGGKPGDTDVVPVMKDGAIVPGHFQ
jgi:Family of unknown function (DUF6111)